MAYSDNKKTARALANYDFAVEIDSLDKLDGGRIFMGVDAVRGLSDAVTNIIYHRSSGLQSSVMAPHAGLSKASPVTLEGIYLSDLGELKALKEWREQCQGKAAMTSIDGYRRNITILHQARGAKSNADLLNSKNAITLKNCICAKLVVGDLDANAQGFATWQIEIHFEELEIA